MERFLLSQFGARDPQGQIQRKIMGRRRAELAGDGREVIAG